MQNSLLIGLSRQMALGRQMDVIANNIANINTAGFKSDGSVFEEYVGSNARADGLSGKDGKVSFVRDRATWMDMTAGPIERTNNALDVAIDGEGFLTVQTPRGERYTRNGALQINSTGQLVTSEGYQVVGESGPITFQPKDHDITISQDGTISVQEGSTTKTESQRGKLKLVSFEQGMLQKDGSGTFSVRDGGAPKPDLKSKIQQGAIEKSNVRGVVEMARMIEVTRSYIQISSLLQQQSDMQKGSLDKLAEVPN